VEYLALCEISEYLELCGISETVWNIWNCVEYLTVRRIVKEVRIYSYMQYFQ